MVYVPVVGSVTGSMNVLKLVESNVLPSGFLMEIPVEPTVPLFDKLTRWLAVPLNVSCAFCPGVLKVSVTELLPEQSCQSGLTRRTG